MLGLCVDTDPVWVNVVEDNLPELLQDHAHCELKAAQNALSMVARFGSEAPMLVQPLTSLAREEMEHLEAVFSKLPKGQWNYPSRDAYVHRLRKAATKDQGVPPLLDRLLVAALIEARSCERFRLLADRLKDASLRVFYHDLMASEARHHRLFLGLAESLFGFAASRERHGDLADREGAIVRQLPLGVAIHG